MRMQRWFRLWGPLCAYVVLLLTGVVVIFIIMVTLARFSARLDALEDSLLGNSALDAANEIHIYRIQQELVTGEPHQESRAMPPGRVSPNPLAGDKIYESGWENAWPNPWWVKPRDTTFWDYDYRRPP